MYELTRDIKCFETEHYRKYGMLIITSRNQKDYNTSMLQEIQFLRFQSNIHVSKIIFGESNLAYYMQE